MHLAHDVLRRRNEHPVDLVDLRQNAEGLP
jgi:hypothetical protein